MMAVLFKCRSSKWERQKYIPFKYGHLHASQPVLSLIAQKNFFLRENRYGSRTGDKVMLLKKQNI